MDKKRPPLPIRIGAIPRVNITGVPLYFQPSAAANELKSITPYFPAVVQGQCLFDSTAIFEGRQPRKDFGEELQHVE